MKEHFLQTMDVAFTEPGTIMKSFKLSDAFDRCKGIAVVTSKTSTALKVSIADNQKTYIQTCPLSLLESSTAVPMQDRFLGVAIPAQGRELQVNFNVPAGMVNETAAFVFLLERDIKAAPAQSKPVR